VRPRRAARGVSDQLLGFELFEMVAHRVRRDASFSAKLRRGERLGTLQLEQDLAPKSFVGRELSSGVP